MIVYSLLALTLTGSPAKAGLVGFARSAPIGLFALVAGAAADRLDRKRIMVAADAARDRAARRAAARRRLLNAIGLGVLLALVVVGRRQGLSGGEIGALVAGFGAAMLVGSLLSPLARRRLPPGLILVLELWTWPLSGGSCSGRACTSRPPR